MNDMTDEDAERAYDDLAGELKQLRTEFAKLGDKLQAVLRNAGRDAAASASEAGERLWSGTKVKADELAKTIQDEPLAFTLGAFGVGFVLGWLFSGRR
jgi:ElaB/YqjD/DUF883 family membrane-anchored ribosome-binding protein